MQAQEIKEKLLQLIHEASTVDIHLAKRLEEINRWVKDIKPGSLTSKKYVLAFLLQVIRDSTVLLKLQALSSHEEQQFEYERMTPTESYWYRILFPKWINATDPKFSIWKQKLMAGEYSQKDADVLRLVTETIIRRKGYVCQRYIIDLSMATDLIISYRQQKILCVQITSVSEELYQEKYEDWITTLQNWSIDRGLFLSYNPSDTSFIEQLANLSLYNSDNLPVNRYLKFP